MRQDFVGDVSVAMRLARNAGLLAGAFGGIPAPIKMAGKFFPPHYLAEDGRKITIAANTTYYAGFWVDRTTTFAGAKFCNSSALDNGKNVRVGIYTESSTGGPGTLEKDFGQSTLTAAAAIRTLANSVVLAGPAWHYIALVSDTTPELWGMGFSGVGSAAGVTIPHFAATQFGSFTGPNNGTAGRLNGGFFIGDTAAFTYAALPATATAPTATIADSDSSTTTAQFPLVGLYV